MRKILTFLFLTLILVSACEAAKPKEDIIILYTNDVHCNIDEGVGYAGLSFYRDEMKKISPYVTLVDVGDWSNGGLIGMISDGNYVLGIMNKVKYDVAVPGNHEFDYSVLQLLNFNDRLSCGLICCNFRDLRTGHSVLKPFKIIDYDGVQVAFIGVTTPKIFTNSTPSFFQDQNGNFIYTFDGREKGKKLCSTIQKNVDELRAAGVDYVILAAHLGEYDDVIPYWSAPYVAANTRGIDAVIDGHSEEITPELKIKNLDSKDVIITQSGSNFMNIGKVIINKDGEISSTLIGYDEIKSRDENISKFIEEIQEHYKETLNQKISHTDFILRAKNKSGNWLLRNGETSLCNLVTDSLLDASAKTSAGKADIALYNSGGIKNDIRPGDITIGNVFDVLPLISRVCIAEVSGQSLLDDLEIGARRLPRKEPGLLHAAGMTYTIDTSIPTPVKVDGRNRFISISGDRRISDVFVNGEKLDPNKIYKVIGIDYYLLHGGDGHLFKDAKIIEPPFAFAYEILGDYVGKFEKLPEKYKNPEGRIKFK